MHIQLDLTQSTQRPPRPMKSSSAVIYRTAANLASKINEWSGDEFQIEIDTLVDAIKYNSLHNAYVVARNLEDSCGIQPDAELVEILDDIWFIKNEVLDDLIKDWVKEYNISPGKKIGDLVTLKSTDPGISEVSGEIVSIDTELARFLVYCESLGHVKEGVGTHGVIVNYEDVE